GSIVDIAHQYRDLGETGRLGGPPATLTGNDLVTSAFRLAAYQNRLDDAMFADRLRQIRKLRIAKGPARILRVGGHEFDWNAAIGHRRRFWLGDLRLVHLADQRGQPAPETLLRKIFSHNQSSCF